MKETKHRAQKIAKTVVALPAALQRRLREGVCIILMAVGLFTLLSFISYHSGDPSWSNTGINPSIHNWGGKVGAFFADVFLYLFGYIAYFIPLAIGYSGWLLLRNAPNPETGEETIPGYFKWIRLGGFILTLIAGCGLSTVHFTVETSALPAASGGILGHLVGISLLKLMNVSGASIVLLAGFLAGITLFTGFSWLKLVDWIGLAILWLWHKAVAQINAMKAAKQIAVVPEPEPVKAIQPEVVIRTKKPALVAEEEDEAPEPKEKPISLKALKSLVKDTVAPIKKFETAPKAEKPAPSTIFAGANLDSLPPLSLLEKAQKSKNTGYSTETLEQLSKLVESKLREFNIEVKVVAIYPGPVITRFELDLAAGVKVSKLASLSKDIARSLSFPSVRIVEVIPGKSYVGIEIPNQHREMVRLSEIISSEEYANSQSPLSLGLGHDIAGVPVVTNLEKMPHLLVAGTTGSGKSVGLNAMLLSLLYKSTPDMVRLIMVDPKMLELSVYDGIPHLLTPVITDMKQAANSLRWSIGEMDRRYKLMSKLGVRNLRGYNEKIAAAKAKGEKIPDPLWTPVEGQQAPELEHLPFIVILVDEFADLMMVVGKKIDELIARLAQKARAAGIHLILATQRPSVDVITGLIKANIPTRIAFQVSSRIDSRTILDQMGAEQLLGHGDMLYLEAGMGHPIRIHGAFVADDEVHRVVQDLKEKGNPIYLDEITAGGDVGGPRADVPGLDLGENAEGGLDELFDQAVEIVAKSRRASISNVQRRLKIGYNRAARILEQMEEQGMVSAMESNGTREVLLPPVEGGEE